MNKMKSRFVRNEKRQSKRLCEAVGFVQRIVPKQSDDDISIFVTEDCFLRRNDVSEEQITSFVSTTLQCTYR
jgi:hypothetical protein